MPFRKINCPSLLLVHHAGYFSATYAALFFKYENRWYHYLGWHLRCYWVRASIKRASKTTVQTQALCQAILHQTNINQEKIIVIPHGAGLMKGKATLKQYPSNRTWRIGYITKHGVQKNFEVLFHATQQLIARGVDCKIVLTLNTEHRYYHVIDALIKHHGIKNHIENHGEINGHRVRELYTSLDLFVFPSLCESFGFTLVEAIHYGCPVLAADIPSNREILGTQGLFFSPHNSFELYSKIARLMANSSDYEQAVHHSLNQSNNYQWEHTASHILTVMNQIQEISNENTVNRRHIN